MLNLVQHEIYRDTKYINAKDSPSVFGRIEESFKAFDYVLNQGYDNWLITFSGGKDSTLTLVLALEYVLKNTGKVERIDVVYSDTLLEIPSIHQYTISFLDYLMEDEKFRELPLLCHIVYPKLEERFWVKVLGKGYPPPHQKFRWCTKRMKIDPCEHGLKEHIIKGKTAILTGVRFGESNARDQRLNASCARGGECGQGLWFEKSGKLGTGYLAPIINWPVCDVWDFLMGFAPYIGYPTKNLEKVYNGHDTRFGCWTCTVVKQDKAMAKTITQPEWAHLQPLYDFRNYLWDVTRPRKARVLRKDGTASKIKLKYRKALLKKLLIVQNKVKMELIRKEELTHIQNMWKQEINK